MLGFCVVNLLVPGNPPSLQLGTPEGPWSLDVEGDFETRRAAIVNDSKCAETYTLTNPVSLSSGASKAEATFLEILPFCLGASFLTGLSVTIKRATEDSEIAPVALSDRFPRERSLDTRCACVATPTAFVARLEQFVASFATVGAAEKATVLVHHWLDCLSCWSLEDLYLSATTVLQVIAATESDRQNKELSFFTATSAAANRAGIRALSADFKNMRNAIVHEGQLSGKKHFRGKSKSDCAAVAADALNWIDEYVHAVLGLGAVDRVRFSAAQLEDVNSYSL